MTTRRGFRWAAAAMLAAAVPSVAAADDRAVREAQARFEEGLKRVKAGDFEAARMSFVQAYVVLHKPDILWNLALSEEKSGHAVDALAHFKQAAKEAPDAADRARARKHVDGLMALTGHIEVQAPAGTPISLDGAGIPGTAPLPEALDVAPGRHVVEARLADGTQSLGVEAVAGEVARASFVLGTPAPPAPPLASPAASPVAPAAGAEGVAPPQAAGPESPRVAVAAASDTAGHGSAARRVTVTALGGGAVIAVGLGVYFGLQSRSDASTAAAYRSSNPSSYCASPTGTVAVTTCSLWSDDVKAQNRDATLSNVLYVAGGVLAAGALASWLFWPGSRETGGGGAWVVPAVGPAGGGVMAGGRF